ncbi:hypothetical protein [Streptomyces sp. NPDC088183]|uniref:hypothetical protein n=1 Tax=Streptomyces sp. NPDC088183 TaxID=3160992 RepID=UPI0034187DFF
MPGISVAHFYDELADDYHLVYEDWNASVRRQGDALPAEDVFDVRPDTGVVVCANTS